MVFVFGNERTFRTGELAFGFDVDATVFPELQFGDCTEVALLAAIRLHFTL